ncbi:MAG: DUF2007 domain-containing protein [Saprospiraceae bacterium]|nr:DUF2007 domain-containing protein [Saprospiraceae bacterium]
MKYTRLIELANVQELDMVKIAFNEAGIHYQVLFENTLQVASVYALGNGGAIVEVADTEVEQAREILSELGIELEFDPEEAKFEFIHKFDELTNKLPLFGSLEVGYRLLSLLGLLAIMVGVVAILYLSRITKEKLVDSLWCTTEIMHDGKKLQPKTHMFIEIKGLNWCNEGIRFREFGDISLPGFDSNNAYGNWEYRKGGVIVIKDMDIFEDIYEGEYEVEEKWNGIVQLTSKRTVIRMVRR